MQRFVRVVLLICCFVFSKNNFSQDIRGGWIEYKWIGGYTYSLTATILFDSAALTAHSIELNGYFYYTPSSISGAGKVKAYKYSIVDTYFGPGTYLNWCDANKRISGIKNIPLSQTKSLYLSTYLQINQFLGVNNSPILTSLPIIYAIAGNSFTYNPGMYDPDGDSLSYQLINCGANPITPYYFPSNSTINSLGNFTYQADTVGLYAFKIEVKEWRKVSNSNYQLIGSTEIDFMVEVVTGVGIKEFYKKETVNIYPNPTSNILNIKTNSKTTSETEIINYLGQTVLKQNYSENIDVSKLVPGCYFIRIDNSYTKFIKE